MWLFQWLQQYFQKEEPSVFYGTVMRHSRKKVVPLKRKRTIAEKKKLLTAAGVLAGLCLLSLILGVLGSVYTLYAHDQIFDWVIYTAILLAVLCLAAALFTLVLSFLKKKR